MVEWRREGEESWKSNSILVPIVLSNLTSGWNVVEMRAIPINTNEQVTPPSVKYYIYKEVYFYEEEWFKVLLWVLSLVIVISLWFIRYRMHSLQKLRLESEIARQTEELDLTCARLIIAQDRVEKQNRNLRQLTDSLETQVKERTAELEREKARIEEASNLKSAFLANLSHEVRTPMNCIVGFSKLLCDPSCTKEEYAEFAHLIRESASSLLALLGDLLDVSRIETGQMRITLSSFPVLKDLQDIYKMLSIEKKNSKVEFILNTTSEMSDVVIHSDRDRFKQILINLVYNAFKFTEKGHVTISASVVDRADLRQYDYPKTLQMPDVKRLLLITVEDTGIGMPEDKIDIIFEPFRKLNNNKTLYPGLGLGLNICKNLIQILGGQIWVKSSLNFGSTFLFYLPITNE
ncbi:MAG: ATP-binding protein, partial [Bacteroidia bacterium]|nr:ATP-binding protein [Bacteroidia bacterium]